MGRPEGPLQRDGSLVREFAFWLRDLRNRSSLTYQQLARAANYATSTMQAAAAGRTLPTLKVTLAFVGACSGDAIAWEKYWTQVKRALDTDSPPDLDTPIRPPWTRAPADSLAARASFGPAAVLHGNGAPSKAAEGRLALREPPALAQSGPAGAPHGWYVETFHALLRMDTPEPEAIEHRVIVAVQDGLTELPTSISVPRTPEDGGERHELHAELLYGGSLEQCEQPFESYFRHVIALAAPLRAGQRHEYQIRLRVPPGQPMSPHYAYVPFLRTEYFRLRVRFPRDDIPRTIQTLCGTPPAVIYEHAPAGRVLSPDRFGEISVEFHHLEPGHAYGMRWER
jgi:hypothetical protein